MLTSNNTRKRSSTSQSQSSTPGQGARITRESNVRQIQQPINSFLSESSGKTDAPSTPTGEEETNQSKRRDLKSTPDKDSLLEQPSETQDEGQDNQESGANNDGQRTPTQSNNEQDRISPVRQDFITEASSSFKVVNCRSSNRRKCKRLIHGSSGNEDGDSTDLHKNRAYTRATLKLTLVADDDPVQALLQQMKDLLQEFHESDEDITLVPWKKSDFKHIPIKSVKDFPSTLTKLKKYFERLYLPKPGESSVLYTGIHFGHTYDFIDVKEDIQLWLTQNNHGLFYNMLQVEDAKEIGWLLYSTREMDAGALADEISEVIGIQIGLRWMTIKTGAKKISDKTRTRALIIETANDNKWKCQRKLMQLYGRTNKPTSSYPNGIRLRFVKLKKDAINAEEKGKLDKLRNRQQNFLKSIKSSTTYDILQLDYSSDAGSIPTLRQMIMSLQSSSKPQTPIFHCVDMDWKEDGFVFQYSPQLAEEAEITLNTLLPLLSHYFPDADVGSNFTNSAEERCLNMVWDDTKKMIVDSEELETEDIREDETLVGFEFNAEVLDAQRPSVTQDFMPGDNDSVSTFQSLRSRYTSAGRNISDKNSTIDLTTTESTKPNTSSILHESQSTEISTLTEQVQTQQIQFQELQSLLHQILQSQQNGSSVVESNKAGGARSRSGSEP